MDAKKIGPFISAQRKELGMTQAQLAGMLHVTDKAVSRWERGIGLPDISIIEALAEALEISLVELMQAKKEERGNISTEEAERMLSDTIRMSRNQEKGRRFIGISILVGLFIISLFLLWLLITDGMIVMHSVGSIITGLIAWGIPIWKITFAKRKSAGVPMLTSMGFAFLSIAIQFMDIKQEAFSGDFSAILDTIHAIILVVILFSVITIILNGYMLKAAEK